MKTHTNGHISGRKQLATCKVRNPISKQKLPLPPSVVQLQRILQKPIQFVPATQLTATDQAKMTSNMTSSSDDYDEHRPDIPGDRRHRSQAEKGPGFRNRNNSCYINSLVIALLHVPKFVNWLEQAHQSSTCPVPHCVACALTNLSLAYWATEPDHRSVELKMVAFRRVIHNASTTENPGWSKSNQIHQHDVQEFYSWLLAKLREQDTLNDRVLKDLFVLSVETKSNCLQCDTKGLKIEPQGQLILPCRDTCQNITRIDQAMDLEFKCDTKSGIECDSGICKNKRVEKEYSKVLGRAPDILCIQFNRFILDSKGNARKSTHRINFDEKLDLSRFTKRDAPLRYRLMAVVHHKGNLEGGHYISTTRRNGDRWDRQDDDIVRDAGLAGVFNPMGGFTPYLLFWAKIPPMKEMQNGPNSKERTRGETGALGQDGTGLSQSKISSKKRPCGEAQGATEWKSERPPSKSAKKSNVSARSSGTHDSPRPDSMSRGRWSSRWLWGGSEVSGNAQEAEKELSECKKEHARKDTLIERQKDLIRRAAITHSQLVASIAHLNASYEESRQATDIILPIMRNIHARGEKYGDKAGKLLKLAKRARHRVRRGKQPFNVSERIARLVKPPKGNETKNETLSSFTKAVEEAKGDDTLDGWLNDELILSDLPVEV